MAELSGGLPVPRAAGARATQPRCCRQSRWGWVGALGHSVATWSCSEDEACLLGADDSSFMFAGDDTLHTALTLCGRWLPYEPDRSPAALSLPLGTRLTEQLCVLASTDGCMLLMGRKKTQPLASTYRFVIKRNKGREK